MRKAESRTMAAEMELAAASRRCMELSSALSAVFEAAGCNTEGVRQLLGDAPVSEANVVQFLGVLEQRTNELIQVRKQRILFLCLLLFFIFLILRLVCTLFLRLFFMRLDESPNQDWFGGSMSSSGCRSHAHCFLESQFGSAEGALTVFFGPFSFCFSRRGRYWGCMCACVCEREGAERGWE